MWSGGDDINDKGESVRLYQPIQYGRKPDQSDLCASFVGGGGQWEEEDRPTCKSCRATCHLLLQLHVPASSSRGEQGLSSRTYHVFACNRAACWMKLFESGPLCYGGDGVVYCRSVTASSTPDMQKETRTSNPFDATPSPWTDVPDVKDDDGGWGDTEDAGLDALESKLNALECNETSLERPKSTPAAPAKNDERRKQSQPECNSFPCFELHSVQEPHARKLEGADDDDVGMGTPGGSSDNDKIQRMLARYMAEEDDEGILAALRGAANDDAGGASGRSGRERDERLSPEDRALLTYTDRLKRSPRQVIRYAREGVPLWSIPVSPVQESSKRSVRGKGRVATLQPVPPGPGGEPRVFTFQLLSSLLHVLQVDHTGSYGSLGTAFSLGGMNWGNIAVFTSSTTESDGPTEEYVVVQESVDGTPNVHQPIGSAEPVVIADGTDFGADSEGEDDGNGEGDDGAEGEMEEEWSDDDA